MLRAAVMLVGVAAACGGDGGSCPPLDGVRQHLASLPPHTEPTVPVVSTGDGAPAPDAVHVVVGDAPVDPRVIDDARAALAAMPGRRVEISAAPAVPARKVAEVARALGGAGELRLTVERFVPPPHDGVAPWLVAEVDRIVAEEPADAAHLLALAMEKAAGKRCSKALDKQLTEVRRTAGDFRDSPAMRAALPDALAECHCRGADVRGVVWLYEQIAFAQREPATLRLVLGPGGQRLDGVDNTDSLARALARLTTAQRTAGVSLP